MRSSILFALFGAWATLQSQASPIEPRAAAQCPISAATAGAKIIKDLWLQPLCTPILKALVHTASATTTTPISTKTTSSTITISTSALSVVTSTTTSVTTSTVTASTVSGTVTITSTITPDPATATATSTITPPAVVSTETDTTSTTATTTVTAATTSTVFPLATYAAAAIKRELGHEKQKRTNFGLPGGWVSCADTLVRDSCELALGQSPGVATVTTTKTVQGPATTTTKLSTTTSTSTSVSTLVQTATSTATTTTTIGYATTTTTPYTLPQVTNTVTVSVTAVAATVTATTTTTVTATSTSTFVPIATATSLCGTGIQFYIRFSGSGRAEIDNQFGAIVYASPDISDSLKPGGATPAGATAFILDSSCHLVQAATGAIAETVSYGDVLDFPQADQQAEASLYVDPVTCSVDSASFVLTCAIGSTNTFYVQSYDEEFPGAPNAVWLLTAGQGQLGFYDQLTLTAYGV